MLHKLMIDPFGINEFWDQECLVPSGDTLGKRAYEKKNVWQQ